MIRFGWRDQTPVVHCQLTSTAVASDCDVSFTNFTSACGIAHCAVRLSCSRHHHPQSGMPAAPAHYMQLRVKRTCNEATKKKNPLINHPAQPPKYPTGKRSSGRRKVARRGQCELNLLHQLLKATTIPAAEPFLDPDITAPNIELISSAQAPFVNLS